jgi:hypothetical protein
MAQIYSPNITNEGLILGLDAESVRSYSGTGTNWTDLSPKNYPNVDMNNNMSAANNYVAATSSSPAYFEFSNDESEYFTPGTDSIGTIAGLTPKEGTFELWFYMTGAGIVFGITGSDSRPAFAVAIGNDLYANYLGTVNDIYIPMFLGGPIVRAGYQTSLNRPISDVYFNEDGTLVPLSSINASTIEDVVLASGRNFQPLLNQWVHLAITYEAGNQISYINNVDGPGSNEYGMDGGPPTIWYINGKKRFKSYVAQPTWDWVGSSWRIGSSQWSPNTPGSSDTSSVTRISQFRMYNRILSESEVSSNYNALKRRYGH